MTGVEVGATRKVAPLRLDLSRSIIFCDMVDWYYRNNDTVEIDYEDIDDRTGLVTVMEDKHGMMVSKNFTIGAKDKKEIERCYLFYHQGTRV